MAILEDCRVRIAQTKVIKWRVAKYRRETAVRDGPESEGDFLGRIIRPQYQVSARDRFLNQSNENLVYRDVRRLEIGLSLGGYLFNDGLGVHDLPDADVVGIQARVQLYAYADGHHALTGASVKGRPTGNQVEPLLARTLAEFEYQLLFAAKMEIDGPLRILGFLGNAVHGKTVKPFIKQQAPGYFKEKVFPLAEFPLFSCMYAHVSIL